VVFSLYCYYCCYYEYHFTAIILDNLHYLIPPVKNWRILLEQTCRYTLADSNEHIQIREKTLEFSSQCYLHHLRTIGLYSLCLLIMNFYVCLWDTLNVCNVMMIEIKLKCIAVAVCLFS